jgi:hypothetical protein
VIRAEDAGRTAELVRRELLGSDAERRRVWVSRAFGDLSAGVATSRFLSVCEELIALRGDELAARQARLPGGSP